MRSRKLEPVCYPADVPVAPTSDVRELGGGVDRESTPRVPTDDWALALLALCEAARQHLERHEHEASWHAATDAVLLLESRHSPEIVAVASLKLGEVLLALSELARARERFAEASIAFAKLGDVASLARASLGFARTLVQLGDPAAPSALEDAGALFEELEDEDAVLEIAEELRAAIDCFGPRSFHARSTLRRLRR